MSTFILKRKLYTTNTSQSTPPTKEQLTLAAQNWQKGNKKNNKLSDDDKKKELLKAGATAVGVIGLTAAASKGVFGKKVAKFTNEVLTSPTSSYDGGDYWCYYD